MKRLLKTILYPWGAVYGGIAAIRRQLYRCGFFKSYFPDILAVGVGNLAVGGTGKTPHTALIAEILAGKCKTAMLSRGYGRKTKGFVLANTVAPARLSADLIGDEPLLLHNRLPKLPLAVSENRKDGIERLLQYAPDLEAVVMDDAYQHLAVTPSCRIILTEYDRPYFQDFPLPAGHLREFPSAVFDADAVIVTKTEVQAGEIDRAEWQRKLKLSARQPLFFTHYAYGNPVPVTAAAAAGGLRPGQACTLLAGIANPEPLRRHISAEYNNVQCLYYPDHHRYTEKDIAHVSKQTPTGAVVFTTEKDWMRLQADGIKKAVSLLPIFTVPIQVEFSTREEKETFINLITELCKKKKEKE